MLRGGLWYRFGMVFVIPLPRMVSSAGCCHCCVSPAPQPLCGKRRFQQTSYSLNACESAKIPAVLPYQEETGTRPYVLVFGKQKRQVRKTKEKGGRNKDHYAAKTTGRRFTQGETGGRDGQNGACGGRLLGGSHFLFTFVFSTNPQMQQLGRRLTGPRPGTQSLLGRGWWLLSPSVVVVVAVAAVVGDGACAHETKQNKTKGCHRRFAAVVLAAAVVDASSL